jgi:type I restriction enzyme S subunit
MKSGWKTYKIEDLKAATKNSLAMGPFGSNIKSDNFVETGVPVIRGVNLNSERFHDDDFVFLTEEKANELANSIAFPNDIIFTHRGTLGQVGIIPSNPKYPRYVVSQSQMKLTVNSKIADPRYIFYFFRSTIGQHNLLMNTSTTGVPAISQPLTSLRNITVSLPPLKIQQKISGILSTLDDKIELNRQMNQTLEAMARSIFKSWFVDFDPVYAKMEDRDYPLPPEIMDLFPDELEESELGLIPKGWRVSSLAQIADYLNGLALQKYPPENNIESLPVIKIRELRSGFPDDQSNLATVNLPDEFIIDDGDIVFSWSGSLLVKIWCGGKGALNQHLFKVTSEDFPKWFYYLWTNYHLSEFQRIASDKATTMGHIKRHHLQDAKVVIPSSELIEQGTSKITPLINKYITNTKIEKLLNQEKEILLPKLLSGEIEV